MASLHGRLRQRLARPDLSVSVNRFLFSESRRITITLQSWTAKGLIVYYVFPLLGG
jgi:hypothetical protein